MTDPTDLTVTEASVALASGEITAAALTEAYLDRIDRFNPILNCYITVTANQARGQAAAADARRRAGGPLGPLDGIPIAIKDNIDVAGVPTSGGFGPRGNAPADRDAEVIRRLREEGAVFLGKLNMHAGALGATNDNFHHGKAHNPWRIGYTPGGSSGGSGSAVAGRLCAAALGTDTMGSVRLPAAYCGVCGLKASFGLVSGRGLEFLCAALDHIGPLARSVGDLGLMLQVMAGYDDDFDDSVMPPDGWRATAAPASLAGLRVGLLRNFDAVDIAPAVKASVDAAIAALREAGAETVMLELADYEPTVVRRAGLLLSEAEAAVIHEAGIERRPEAYAEDFLAMLAYGRDLPAARFVKAELAVKRIGAAAKRLLREVDVIAAPTAAQTAFPFGEPPPANQADLTAMANFAGAPAVSLPCGLSPEGLPISLQLIAAPFAEARLLGIAATVEALLGFDARPPEPDAG